MSSQQTAASKTTSPKNPNRKSKTGIWKQAMGFALAFLLFLCVLGLFVSLDLRLGLLNQQTVVTAVAKSEYSLRAYEQLREDMEALIKSHGLDPKPVLSLLDENQFYAASGNRIDGTLQGDTERIDTTVLQKDLRGEIQKQLLANGVPLTPAIATAVDEIAFAGGNLYDKHGYFQFGEELMKAKQQTLPMAKNLFLVSLAGSALLTALLAVLYRRRHLGLSLINYALFAGVLANGAIVTLLYATNPIGEAMAAPYYLHFIDQYLLTSLVPGIGLCGIGLIVCTILWVTNRRIREEA